MHLATESRPELTWQHDFSGLPQKTRPDDSHQWSTAICVLVLTGASCLSTLLVGSFLLRRLVALETPAYDLAVFQQLMWGLSRGYGLFSGLLSMNYFGVHFSPLLVLMAPIELIWPDARVLSLVEAVAVGATGPSAFLLLQELLKTHRSGRWVALALAAPVPFLPVLQQAVLADFHPEMVALPLWLLAAWAGLRGRTGLLWLLAVVATMAKEDQVFLLVVVGALVFFQAPPIMRRQGLTMSLAGLCWGVLVFVVLMPLFRQGKVPDTAAYYGWLLHSPKITELLSAVVQPTAWLQLFVLVASFGLLPLLRPGWLVLALPPFITDVLSHHTYQAHIELHYGLLLVLPVLIAAGLGADCLLGLVPRPLRFVGLLPACACLCIALAGAILPPSSPPLAQPKLNQLQMATARLPANAPVAVDDGLAPLMASRPNLDLITSASPSTFVLVDRVTALPTYVDQSLRDGVLAELPAESRKLLYHDGELELWGPVGY